MKTKRHEFTCRLLVTSILMFMAPFAVAGVPSDQPDPMLATLGWTNLDDEEAPMAGASLEDSANQRLEALMERAWTKGTIPIIVRFKDQPAETTGSGSISAQAKGDIKAARQRRVLDHLGLREGRDRVGAKIKGFDQMPGLAMRADALDLLDLLDQPEVLEVFEDVAYPPALLESLPLVGATLNGDFKGYSGQGQVIAILDTGVDKSHAFLKDKIVSEACYSTNNSSEGVSSLCPQGVTASTAIGSGVNCNASLSGCSHGTHVAGIAAGKGEKFSGVAREAKLISIQVYSRFPASACGGAPCAMAYTSDIIRGLERVRSLGTQYAIAAANLSLGGGAYTSYCDWDSTKPMIDALLAEGIATVIASGNGYYSNAISAPGCVSSAITVGSTTTKNSGTYPDQVSDFSNSAHFLDLLAPGERIESSVIGGGYAYYMGTSMAAPHVAGAWAVLKSAKPNAEVEEILAALQTSGKPIQDPYNSLTKQRIQVDVALANLQAGEAPTQPSPSLQPKNPLATAGSAINSQSFVANWNGVNEAAGYRLDVSTVSNFASYLKGYRDLDVAPTTSRSIDGLKPSVTYFYRVRAYNSVGTSLNSNVVSITTTPAPPPTPTGKKATSITTDRFTANWGVTTGAVGYRLDVSTDASFRHFLNGFLDLDVGNAISFKVTGLSPGMTYYYRGRAYNSGGVSGSSKAQAAKTLVAIPQAPSARPATNITTKAFVANWDLVDGATGYRLDVSTSAAFTSFLSGYNNLNVGNRVYRNITRLSPNTIYYYRVRAYNKTGTGLDSGIQTVRTAR